MARDEAELGSTSFREFLENAPPGRRAYVNKAVSAGTGAREFGLLLFSPIELYCAADACDGRRIYETVNRNVLGDRAKIFVTYRCRNCGKTFKVFALAIARESQDSEETFGSNIMKFGEDPPFGPPTPARVITLLGPEKEYYLKGRRAEN